MNTWTEIGEIAAQAAPGFAAGLFLSQTESELLRAVAVALLSRSGITRSRAWIANQRNDAVRREQ